MSLILRVTYNYMDQMLKAINEAIDKLNFGLLNHMIKRID